MSDAVIDVTRRARIRALAVRMHRAGIAGVFFVGGGAPSVDESTLTDNQRSEAAKIFEETTATSVDIKDVETAASVAVIIPRHVKPSCSTCHGGGVVSRGSVDDICDCVDRRWQAVVDHQTFVDGLHAPGRASGVRVKSTRAVDDAKRLTSARAKLSRVRAAATDACADIDAGIKVLEDVSTAYFAAREPLIGQGEVVRVARVRATAIDADVRKEATTLGGAIHGDGVAPAGADLTIEQAQALRAAAHAAVDRVYDAIDCYVANAAVLARAEANVATLAELDEKSRPVVERLTELRAERDRITRRYQPKIDRAERKVRRLAYLTSSGSC